MRSDSGNFMVRYDEAKQLQGAICKQYDEPVLPHSSIIIDKNDDAQIATSYYYS